MYRVAGPFSYRVVDFPIEGKEDFIINLPTYDLSATL
jgi:hypothetical protein